MIVQLRRWAIFWRREDVRRGLRIYAVVLLFAFIGATSTWLVFKFAGAIRFAPASISHRGFKP